MAIIDEKLEVKISLKKIIFEYEQMVKVAKNKKNKIVLILNFHKEKLKNLQLNLEEEIAKNLNYSADRIKEEILKEQLELDSWNLDLEEVEQQIIDFEDFLFNLKSEVIK